MPSPFPGMDPYIEKSRFWPDFYNDMAGEMRARINRVLPPGYVARAETYVTYEIIETGESSERRGVRPDAAIYLELPQTGDRAASATLIAPAPIESSIALEVPLRLSRVEIRVVEDDLLVTVIEILSPVNKRPGHESRTEYLRKRQHVLRSMVHLLEIDLLRGGDRSPLEKPVPPAPYYVTLSREDRRPRVEVWPIQLRDPLPVLPVPLRDPDPDVPLDLGALVAAVYERGRYADQINYREPPPPPPLSPEEQAWLDDLLRERRTAAGA
jgi:hypothetical protein